MNEEKTFTEEIKVSGEQLVDTVKKLIHEANVRRVIIKNEEGKTLIEMPVSIAGVGVILAPIVAAVGAIAAVVTNCTIVVVKEKE
ncbi:MAG: DUF4342 domain-containing protein [bacterium]|nr:DUF4342 domain-containing protein [bacterium]